MPTYSIRALDAVKNEGTGTGATFTFEVVRAGTLTQSGSVVVATAPWASGSASQTDFVGGAWPKRTVSFAVNETRKVVSFQIAGDSTVEGNEGFNAFLTSPVNGTLVGPEWTAGTYADGYIINDDAGTPMPLPKFTIRALNAAKPEGTGTGATLTFEVARVGDLSRTGSVRVEYGGWAQGGTSANDFASGTLPALTVSFAVNEAAKTVSVPMSGDSTVEADEGFNLLLVNPVNGVLDPLWSAGTVAGGQIYNDDSTVTPPPAPGRAGTFADYMAAVRQRESSGNYRAENTMGAIGAYQFHEIALADIGWYAAPDATGYGNQDWIGPWTSKAHAWGVYSKQDLLNNPAAQDQAFKEYAALTWGYLTNGPWDLESYAGQTINGVYVTASGMISGSSLMGGGAVHDWLHSGGAINPGDGYGTSLESYLKLFSNYETPFWPI